MLITDDLFNLDNEIWRSSKEYEGKYSFSNKRRVKAFKSDDNFKFLTVNNGYVTLTLNFTRKCYKLDNILIKLFSDDLEIQKIESKKIEKENIKKEKIESKKIEKENIKKEKIEAERIEREAERIEKENIKKEKLEKIEAERIEKENIKNLSLKEKIDYIIWIILIFIIPFTLPFVILITKNILYILTIPSLCLISYFLKENKD